MSESVSLPALGESVTEGTVTRWLKNVGDRVEVDEPLLEVSTDKVDTEIPSPVAGVIESILVQEDETVEVGAPLVTIGTGEQASESPAPATPEEQPQAAAESQTPEEVSTTPEPAPDAEPEPQAEQQPAVTPSTEAATPAEAPTPAPDAEPVQQAEQPPAPQQTPTQQAPTQQAEAQQAPTQPAQTQAPQTQQAPATRGTHAGTGYVTPIVRKLANEQGVDLSTVTGTGAGGRIRKQDVLDAGNGTAAPRQTAQPEISPLRGTTQAMSRLRKVVAERAVASMQASAQLTTVVEVDVTAVAALRDRVKGEFQSKTGTKLSFLPFFTLAAAEALKTYPIINATVEGDSIVYPDTENISIAVDTERGLLTPVVRDAGRLDIAGLSQEIADLAARTRDNQLKPDELAGGTFTVTNTGSRGALFDTPVVFLPQVAILGTGIVTKKPVVVSVDGSDAIAIRSTVYLSLSYDHRIVDGADAARFLVAVKQRLEEADFEENLGI